MLQLTDGGVLYQGGAPVPAPAMRDEARRAGRRKTVAYRILSAHDTAHDDARFSVRFDALVSHDITYVGIIQTARASGLTAFPVPYAMTNCHNSLCAVGGTINEDDHAFGLSAAKKYGGVYVPANLSVIHSYAREELAGCGKMILGSDSHTRYGALGTMGVGEGGPELVKQLLQNTWDVPAPEVVLVWLTGAPKRGIGPHDAALALVKATFESGFVKNRVLEFAGPGLAALPVDFRCAMDCMTTETTCLTSIWQTDDAVRRYYETVGRPQDFCTLAPEDGAYYDRMISLDLSALESMIALPFHPSNAYPVRTFLDNAADILAAVEADARQRFPKAKPDLLGKVFTQNGKTQVRVDQGVIAGCAGGLFDNITEAADILGAGSTGNGPFSLSVYPTSVPVSLALTRAGVTERLLETGAVIKPSFCGPCFGAGDVPANNALSIRHTTRNFPNREGSKPGEGQLATVALMDARSIAATAANGGVLTAATEVDYTATPLPYRYDRTPYEKRCYNGFGRPLPETPLVLGPNITDWPEIPALADDLLLELAAVIHDPVTTTDELIPSGETSSYRSNPLRLAEFTLSRRVPAYVGRAKAIRADEAARRAAVDGDGQAPAKLLAALDRLGGADKLLKSTQVGSCVFAEKPGDGSAREQAASCQRVLGGMANICREYATKRYRSNCINWGMLPFTLPAGAPFPYAEGDMVFVPAIRAAVAAGNETVPATVLTADGALHPLTLLLTGLTDEERAILLDGCLMNRYAAKNR